MVARVALLMIAALALAACSGSTAKRTTAREASIPPSFDSCAAAWNARSNRAKRSVLANEILPAGYGSAKIELSYGSVPEYKKPHVDPNPVGCRVVFYNRGHWVAYLAGRKGAEFQFPAALPRGRESDQRGVWPKAAQRGPSNATVGRDGKLTYSG